MSIYKKLLSAKKEMEAITKDSKNPFFKSNYFDVNKLLLEVEPILQKNGLLLLQPLEDGLVKSMIFDSEEGSCVCSSLQLPEIKDPQKIGSAITYYRRYTLQSLLGLQAEDDDGNNASKQIKNQQVKQNVNKSQSLKDSDRLPALKDSEFQKTLSLNKNQIKKVLDNYRMSSIQREELTKLLNNKING